MLKHVFIFLFVFVSLSAFSNKRASELYVDLQKFHSLKRVLYVAAHPDDENTRALAWFSLGQKAETAYLSLTRGDGGQNLIGNELSEELGVLRTQELLAARRFDRARQYFSRAVDFGYSKSAKESLQKWGKEQILSDVVLVIRQFRPDVIITRFPPDKRGGHGHHTASAMLAIEAFDLAADPNYLPKQVKKYGTWQATSIYWNTSVWWNKEIADSAKNNPDFLEADIGGYNPLLGMSYNEIGTLARSEHKCQGFGAVVERGERIEYFQHLGGVKLKESFFENNELSWSKLVNPAFEKELDKLLKDFNFINPEKNIPSLLFLLTQLRSVKPSTLVNEKISSCNDLIINCIGLYTQVTANDYSYVKGDSIQLTFQAVKRSDLKVIVDDLSVNGIQTSLGQMDLVDNATDEFDFKILPNTSLAGPYWLRNEFDNTFNITNEDELGLAEALPSLNANIELIINNVRVNKSMPVEYIWRVPDYGEKRRDVICTPDFTASFEERSAILKEGGEKTLRMKIHSFKDSLLDQLKVNVPNGWVAKPSVIQLDIKSKHEEQWIDIKLTATENSVKGPLTLTDSKGSKVYSYKEIAYNHIPTQTLMNPVKIQCVKLDAEIVKGKVAYIKGVDDAVPAAIANLGFEIKELEVDDLATIDLSSFQTVVLGIRIYNVHPELVNYKSKMLQYIEKGGNLIMQYNTASRSFAEDQFGPFPFELSRDRVTEEDAKVVFLDPKHPFLNTPNKITEEDFNDWVQERGLYFANNWNEAYTPLFSWHDEDEDAKEGALIVAKYGKGQFVYTGISFFRELPNGVEGAYRLFANLLSYQP